MLYRTPLYYNNFNLSTFEGIAIYNHDFLSMPSRNLTRSKLARADKSVLTSAEYVEKVIVIQGIATGSNRTEIDTNFERLKGVLQVPEGVIRVGIGNTQVEWTGTLSASSHHFTGKHIVFEFSFLCSNPIGSDRLTSTLLDVTNTNPSAIYTIQVDGSFKALPVFKVLINSGSGLTNKTIQVLNSNTNQGILVTRTWTAGELLTVDSYNKDVEVDDNFVDYSGVFPSFFPGERSFQYIDDFTTRSVDIDITYKKQYA